MLLSPLEEHLKQEYQHQRYCTLLFNAPYQSPVAIEESTAISFSPFRLAIKSCSISFPFILEFAGWRGFNNIGCTHVARNEPSAVCIQLVQLSVFNSFWSIIYVVLQKQYWNYSEATTESFHSFIAIFSSSLDQSFIQSVSDIWNKYNIKILWNTWQFKAKDKQLCIYMNVLILPSVVQWLA